MSGRETRMFAVLGFGSTHAALDAEELLESQGVDVVPIPAPSTLSATCGIALRIEIAEMERAAQVLQQAGIELTAHSEIEDL